MSLEKSRMLLIITIHRAKQGVLGVDDIEYIHAQACIAYRDFCNDLLYKGGYFGEWIKEKDVKYIPQP